MSISNFIKKVKKTITSKKEIEVPGAIWFGQILKPGEKPTEEQIRALKENFKQIYPHISEAMTEIRASSSFGVGVGFGSSDNAVDGLVRLFDWKGYGGFDSPQNFDLAFAGTEAPNGMRELVAVQKATETDGKPSKKPKEVVSELDRLPHPDITPELLEQKISLLKDKKQLSLQHFVVSEIDRMILCLENRKKYNDFKDFYEKFPNTSDEKIDALCANYKLACKGIDLFVPEMPKEAIEVMKAYKEHTKKLCDRAPVFYLIAKAEDFQRKRKERDPILLAQSPFGMYWQVLGAWDEEMILLSEL